jgi:tetratricopeptide (TPR) repeat protein
MGVYNAELYTNLGLCCFYSQQYDMTLNCFMRALAIATDENVADVWYNLSHVALVSFWVYFIFLVYFVKNLPESDFPHLLVVSSNCSYW